MTFFLSLALICLLMMVGTAMAATIARTGMATITRIAPTTSQIVLELVLAGVGGGNNGAGKLLLGPTAGVALTSAPHNIQNLCLSFAAWPHFGQNSPSFPPPQKFYNIFLLLALNLF